MKTLIKLIPILVLAVACMPKTDDSSDQELVNKRDSIQNVIHDLEQQVNQLNLQIAMNDSSTSEEELKLIKKIAMKRTSALAINKKLKVLENQLASMKKTKSTIPVSVKTIQPEEFNHYLVVYGNVEATKSGMISPEMGGRIEAIYVEEGQRVSKGDKILTLNTDAVDRQIGGVKSSLEFATTTYNKQKALWDQGIGSEIQYLNAKTTKETLESQLQTLKAQLQMSQISAPYDGIVDKIYLKKGEIASPAMPVVEFVNLSQLTIKADVSEAYIGSVKKGDIVEVSFSSIPDYSKEIRIANVSKVINPSSRTFEIELELPNSNEIIKPNMVSTISINDYEDSEAFVLPTSVIRKDITGDYVYIVNEKDNEKIVEKRYITPGISYNENTMIAEGLNQGDEVIVKGYHMVSSGINVNIVE